MGKTEWTPGEWRSFTDDKGFSYVIADVAPTGYIVATGGFGEESEANARLIAAVPDLYAALAQSHEHVCSLLCPSVYVTADGPPPHSELCRQIRATLARARGEQP